MLEALSELPKAIDAFISGVIEFAYRFVVAVGKVARRPLRGALDLHRRETDLSSRTMLFCAAALLSAAYFVTLPNIMLLGESASLKKFLLRVAVFYVAFDLLALVAALVAGGGTIRTRLAHTLLRYDFAGSLVTVSVVAFVVQALAIGSIWDFQAWTDELIKRGGAVPTLVIILIIGGLFFYHPAVAFLGILARRSPSRRKFVALLVVTLVAIPGCLAILYGSQRMWVALERNLSGGLIAINLVCDAYPGRVHVTAVLKNQRDSPTAISRDSLELEVALAGGAGLSGSEALAEKSFDTFFTKLDGGAIIIQPDSTAIFQADAYLREDEYERVGVARNRGACRLLTDRFSGAFKSSIGRLHKEYEDSTDNKGAAPPSANRSADDLGVPLYGPGAPPVYRPGTPVDPSAVPKFRPDGLTYRPDTPALQLSVPPNRLLLPPPHSVDRNAITGAH